MYESVEKSSKVQVATLIDPDVFEALQDLAKSHERSVAAELRLAIKLHLARIVEQAA